MAAQPHVIDQIVVVLQREGGRVSKEKLQELTGLGTQDLRDGLQDLVDSDRLDATATGYELVEAGTPVAASPVPAEEPEPDEDHALLSATDTEEDGDEAVYETTVRLTVRYGAESNPVEEAAQIAQAARNGIAASWPDLEVTGKVERVVALRETTLYEA